MRTVRDFGWIPRAFVYLTAIAVIAAAWELIGVLYAPAPRLSSYGMDSFRASILEGAQGVVSEREDALRRLGQEAQWEVALGSSLPGPETGAGAFELARSGAVRALQETIGPVEQYASPGALPPTLALDEALDEADKLYGRDTGLYVATAERMLREGMAAERRDYIQRWAYNRLVATVRADVISYRSLESLPIQEAKEGIYETRFRSTRDALAERRKALRGRRDELYKQLQSAQSSDLTDLVDRAVSSLGDEGTESPARLPEMKVLDDILSQLAGFKPLRFARDREVPMAPKPTIDHRAWLRTESGLSEDFLNDIKGNERSE